ncbi:MAG: winged helix-turn-helix transcriptional regulator [Pseudomonadota bacterium]
MPTATPRKVPAANTLSTRASSITRALDEVGDKWCLLIIQEVFWGINTFSGMLAATGVSRGVLSDRLKWLQSVGCLRKDSDGGRGGSYHLTRKSLGLHASAMMAIEWERRHFNTPALDSVQLVHTSCGQPFRAVMRCAHCGELLSGRDVHYTPGPGATRDQRVKKVRRRSSLSAVDVPSPRSVYRNLVDIVGDRWTANVIALAFHGHARFDEFHRELPVATNILSDRLKFLENRGVFIAEAYQANPQRFEYRLTQKGWDLFPFFLTLLQWGNEWCDPEGRGAPMLLEHTSCGAPLRGVVLCDQCDEPLEPFSVTVVLP